MDRLTSNQTFGTIHSNSSDGVFTQMLSNFQDQLSSVVFNFQGVQNSWQFTLFELDIDNGTNDSSKSIDKL
ncbi:unnamed protein product [Ambrosiozyma monospora]|uniref:Unnamed protein product n=1 Tax=Ambrosiozyma monospora TaxID=43982 RepID=A0A9W6Z415_AMBMO|nr:unnamed protein product [Ambrosiozyma monospora]